jgi:hypothetical protein
MTHPNSLDLEAFACGETAGSIENHLSECATCSAFVERLRGALSAGPSRARAADAVARAATHLDHVDREGSAAPERLVQPRSARALEHQSVCSRKRIGALARRRWLMTASTVAVPLAAAAVLLLLVRTGSTPDTHAPLPSLATTGTVATTTADPAPETTFKGGIQVAVIRERAGHQARFTGSVEVKPGDRLRVEVALDREQAILAAVMGDDTSWIELMPERVLRPGTHFSDRSAHVDSSPMHGTILVGAPEAVAGARASRRFDDVAAIRVAWEAP